MYEYRATCTRVVDGDTLLAEIDAGLRIKSDQVLRVAGLDTPELRASDPKLRARAAAAKARVMELLPVGGKFVVRTEKDTQDRYGRWLAHITLSDGRSLNALLLSEGLAVTYTEDARGLLVRGDSPLDTAAAAGIVLHRAAG